MTRHNLKPIIIGIAIGVALFAVPFFLLRTLLFFLIAGALFKLFRGRIFRKRQNPALHPAFADVIHYMNEDEYRAFREKLEKSFQGYSHSNYGYPGSHTYHHRTEEYD